MIESGVTMGFFFFFLTSFVFFLDVKEDKAEAIMSCRLEVESGSVLWC